MRRFALALWIALLVTACSPATPGETTSEDALLETADPAAEEDAAAVQLELPPIFFEVAKVRTISSLPAPDGGVYLVTGIGEEFILHRLSAEGEISLLGAFNGEVRALVSSVEPPGLVIDQQGLAHLTWVGVEDGLVWYARADLASHEFSAPLPVSQAGEEHHAVMPVVAVDADGTINVVWLQGLNMQLAESSDGGLTFVQTQLDEEVCDCCRPSLYFVEGELYIAFRESQYDQDGRNYRDVHLGRYADGEFEAWPVADEHWYLNVCPVAGPGFVVADGWFSVVWMDGRANQAGSLAQSDIWFSASPTDEVSFSANLRINQGEGIFNRPPTLSRAEDGALAIAWIADAGAASTIYYSISTDGGQSFGEPVAVYESAGPLTAPKSIALTHSGAFLYLAFTDLDGMKVLQINQ